MNMESGRGPNMQSRRGKVWELDLTHPFTVPLYEHRLTSLTGTKVTFIDGDTSEVRRHSLRDSRRDFYLDENEAVSARLKELRARKFKIRQWLQNLELEESATLARVHQAEADMPEMVV
jgi:hypothetical protein